MSVSVANPAEKESPDADVAKSKAKKSKVEKVAKTSDDASDSSPKKSKSEKFDFDKALGKPAKGSVPLKDLNLKSGTQSRVKIDKDTVEIYAKAMEDGEVFPPVKVVEDESGVMYLIDGFHRVTAALSLNFREFPAEVYRGSMLDAQFFSLSANREHAKVGLRRSFADIRRSIRFVLTHPVFGKMPSRAIAAHIGDTTHTTVNEVKKEMNAASAVKAEVDPAGLTPGETGVAQASVPSSQAQDAADPAAEAINIQAQRISDDEFLGRCPAYGKLKGKCKDGFAKQAILVRRAKELPAWSELRKGFQALIGKDKNKDFGPAGIKIHAALTIPDATEWKICVDCSGEGSVSGNTCSPCRGEGYHVVGK